MLDVGQSHINEPSPLSQAEIGTQSINLMHPLMKNCDDADVAIPQLAPINDMTLITKKEAFNAEVSWNRARHHTVGGNLAESLEQPGDVSFRLVGTPLVTRIAVDFVETV